MRRPTATTVSADRMKAPRNSSSSLTGCERRLGLAARQAVGAGARQLAAFGRLVDVGRAQRVGLDAGLVDEREAPRRAGGEHEFRTADHADCREYGLMRRRWRRNLTETADLDNTAVFRQASTALFNYPQNARSEKPAP